MAMELEYPFKIILYIFVIAVIVGMLVVFKSKFSTICLIPPCNDEKKTCDIKPSHVREIALSVDIINKYNRLCHERSKECKEDVFCYIVSLDNSINPSGLTPSCLSQSPFCENKCNNNVNIVYFFYDFETNKVQIGC